MRTTFSRRLNVTPKQYRQRFRVAPGPQSAAVWRCQRACRGWHRARPDHGHSTQFATRSTPFVTQAVSSQSLPDILAPGLSVIFCGINPGNRAASTGHHFAGRDNRFWRVVHLAGFTPDELRPEDDQTFLQYECGLTTAVSRPTARADELSREEIKAAASAFERKIERYEPRYIAFLGKMAISGMSGKRDIEWGLQPKTFGGARCMGIAEPQWPQPGIQPRRAGHRLPGTWRCHCVSGNDRFGSGIRSYERTVHELKVCASAQRLRHEFRNALTLPLAPRRST